MKCKVSRVDIYSVNIPFKSIYRHALKKRESSESVFVRIESENNTVGFGESLPRDYVTGENQDSVIKEIESIVPAHVLNKQFTSFNDVIDYCASLNNINGAVKCAIELALLDTFGKEFKKSLSDIFEKRKREYVRYGVGIGADDPARSLVKALKYRAFGFKDIKLKVGDNDDVERLRYVRAFSGNNMVLRLDANCAWSVQEAIAKLNIMKGFSFNLIEQPVAKDDISSLKKVSDAIDEPVMADEAICTIEDAKRLAHEKACDMFNIRLSKCGGILNSIEIARFAENEKIPYQLGCQVGESGVLSAAGRHFAFFTNPLYLEGSYGSFLLKEDIVSERVSFKYGGVAGPIGGFGLGVSVDENKINKYVTDRVTIK